MEQVILRYDGDALGDHSMNLKLIAESLSGLDDLIHEVYEEMGGTEDEIDLQIKGGFQEGSFEFLMTVGQTLQDNIEILKIVGFGLPPTAGSLLTYLQWLKGRKIDKITLTEEGNCKITTEDGEVKESPSYMRPLLASASIRTAFNKVVSKPLRGGGIEVFEAIANNDARTRFNSVTTAEEKYFRSQRNPVNNVVVDKPIDDVVITFLTVHKDKDTHWRIDLDGEAITIKMEDDTFLSNFRKGKVPDIFVNAYSVMIYEKENTITMDKTYSIVKVYARE
ncbi:hypothetical protein [Shewanella baltica]|uniref:hypothetical protein n=1 Tax=Shewanella baltica TaxID=62322 RepID=UPI00217D4E94|nr:hypothetical protein [Shewanella baltica]MCS6177717.1 hypothetical protein [Shewanella baltica]MCS6253863.1 hypothetical protein [Shewanella baltica]